MSFQPGFCPLPDCPSRSGTPFTYRRCGHFFRHCDQRSVQRFECLTCSQGFSEQTFRVNYRLKRPHLLSFFFLDRVSKVTHRQSARNHACSRTTEERHFRRLSTHCEAFHAARLAEITARGGLGQAFLLDELETYEHHRNHKPLTVPILIERESGFVIDAGVGTLPARRRRGIRLEGEALQRKSESNQMTKAAFERLRQVCPKQGPLIVLTDRKTSYVKRLRDLFGKRCLHLPFHSKLRRDPRNPLRPINHTLARVRDNVSRLVRETWAASKLKRWLAGHLAIFVCYRNYVRGRINHEERFTPAMALGFQDRCWRVEELLEWRVFPYI